MGSRTNWFGEESWGPESTRHFCVCKEACETSRSWWNQKLDDGAGYRKTQTSEGQLGVSALTALTGLSLTRERKSKRNLFTLVCWAFSTSEMGLQDVISKSNREDGQGTNTQRKVNFKSTIRAEAASIQLAIGMEGVSSLVCHLKEGLGESISKPALSKVLPQLFCASLVQSLLRQWWPLGVP